MNALYFSLGILLLLLVVLDLLWTTLWVEGHAGPLSSRLTAWLWRGWRGVARSNGLALSMGGPLIMVLTLFTWVGVLWAGWILLFASSEGAIIDPPNQEPVTAWPARIYFVAYALFTMGNGDFSPSNGFWQLMTSLTTASGMLFITLGVSYVLSVLSAVNQRRAFANGVSGLGARSEEFLCNGWNGEDFRALDLPLHAMSGQLSRLAEQHKAYPILHYYRSAGEADAMAVAVAVLDEALTLLCFAIPEERRPNPAVTHSIRATIFSYLETLQDVYIQIAERHPPPPELSMLRAAGIPTLPDEQFAQALDTLEARRRKLLGALEADAWPWPPVQQ